MRRVLGLVCVAVGRREEAATHFEQCIAGCRSVGIKPELAWALADYAEMLMDNGTAEQRRTVRAMQDEALQIANHMGMKPLIASILKRRQILKA